MSSIDNPILPGFHPDPSVCRVGDDYYLVTSSFSYFPGIPVYHSRDLATWTPIGHVLDRPGQLPLGAGDVSRGIFAATIRHHRGTFYVITTNVDAGGNFLVTATDPAGPWSDPVWLPGAPGIDPSLYFEGDRVWYCGTRPRPAGPQFFGDWEVWVQELDPRTWTFVGESWTIWNGALKGAIWPEGPHLYRHDGWYYLISAEGGTDRNHAVTVARSRDLAGPWEGKPANPLLTHRDLGRGAAIVNVGHADLFDAPDGSWWMVVLGSRPYGGGFCNLGRETFLVPVGWEDGWPVANPGVGRVEARVEVPGTPVAPPPVDTEAFDGLRLGPDWITLRVPDRPFGDLASTPGRLRLASRPARPGDQTYWSFAGKRQGHPSFLWSAVVNFAPDTPQGAAGLVLFQNDGFHIRFERAAEGGQPVVRVVVREAGAESVAASVPTVSGPLTLEVTARLQDLEFAWAAPGGRRSVVARGVDGRLLSTERAGGFVGTILALFATGGGQESRANADFSAWTYRGLI